MIYDAIQVLEKEMLEEKRVQPNEYVFSTLIGVLARAGYTSKAFEVFRKVRSEIEKSEVGQWLL